ncbi:sporulation protein YtxC [Salipaludibacillus sp. HK11]|uniref:sporulation protein YtxC n=1 Tax=Salipaludibacillus sp. HK11 TaxID=3394320 RepID=UPI0039FC106E
MLTIEFKDSFLGETFYEQLRHSLSILTGQKCDHIQFSVAKTEKRFFLSIDVFSQGGQDKEQAIITVLTNTTARIFFVRWVEEYLRKTFHYEDDHEIQAIMETAKMLFFPTSSEKQQIISMSFIEWQQEVYNQLAPFVNERISFSFDSFISFRLQSCKEKLLELVEKAIDEYRMEMDYQMMLQKCRDFLEQNPPKVETVYVYMKNGIKFYDGKKREITFEQVCKWLETVTPFEKFLPLHERMIGPLVSMAPKKIVIKSEECDDDLFHTLKNIFEERIVLDEDEKEVQYRSVRYGI